MGPDLAEGIILARDGALIFHRMMVTLRGNRSRCAPAQVQTRECHVAPPTLFRRSNDIQPNVRGFRHWHILWAARLHCVPNRGSGVGMERSSRTWHLHLLHHRCLRRSRCGEAVEQEEDECFDCHSSSHSYPYIGGARARPAPFAVSYFGVPPPPSAGGCRRTRRPSAISLISTSSLLMTSMSLAMVCCLRFRSLCSLANCSRSASFSCNR